MSNFLGDLMVIWSSFEDELVILWILSNVTFWGNLESMGGLDFGWSRF